MADPAPGVPRDPRPSHDALGPEALVARLPDAPAPPGAHRVPAGPDAAHRPDTRSDRPLPGQAWPAPEAAPVVTALDPTRRLVTTLLPTGDVLTAWEGPTAPAVPDLPTRLHAHLTAVQTAALGQAVLPDALTRLTHTAAALAALLPAAAPLAATVSTARTGALPPGLAALLSPLGLSPDAALLLASAAVPFLGAAAPWWEPALRAWLHRQAVRVARWWILRTLRRAQGGADRG